MTVLRTIWRGLHYSDKYGSHPGTPWMVLLPFVGFLAGIERGWRSGLIGALAMVLIFGPPYLFGAYERGR
jgi:hypothetical protein